MPSCRYFMLKMFRSAACAHGREARRVLGAFISRNTKSVPLVPFRVHSRASSRPLPGLAFARPHPIRFTSPKSLSRGSKFLFLRKVCAYGRVFFRWFFKNHRQDHASGIQKINPIPLGVNAIRAKSGGISKNPKDFRFFFARCRTCVTVAKNESHFLKGLIFPSFFRIVFDRRHIPTFPKYRQADVLETLLYKQMHINMLKTPSGRRFENLAI